MFQKTFSLRKRIGKRDPSPSNTVGDDQLANEQESPQLSSRQVRDSLAQDGYPSPETPTRSLDATGDVDSVDERTGQLLSNFASPSSFQLKHGNEDLNANPLGLRVLHRPRGLRKADIIFVHGLGGSSRATWSKHRNPELFWPLTFLPTEPGIQEARILTFGYNSNFKPGSGKTRVSVLDFAKDLLYDLKYAQDDSQHGLHELNLGTRPIIFVVHSMGGLIVKEAYMQGQHDPAYETIVKSISAIIFLSTPHRGTNLAETLNRILQVSFVAAPMHFIAELSNGSQTLQKLNEQFRHIAPKLQIVSFYETRPTTVFKRTQFMVLEKESSVLGYPGEVSKPLDADHHSICKYENPKDPLYVAVRNVLVSLLAKIQFSNLSDPTSPDKLSDAWKIISDYGSSESDYNFFRDSWVPGTCNWMLSEPSYMLWLEETSLSRIMWVHGNAACGKSILCSFIIDHLARLGHCCQYFFVRFEDDSKRSPAAILRSLAYQLARSVPEYAEELEKMDLTAIDIKTADHRTIWQWFFQKALLKLRVKGPLFWVIDGLDEAIHADAFIKLLSDIRLACSPIRILLVSRKLQSLTTAIHRLEKHQLHVHSLLIEGNHDDIQAYIKEEMYLNDEDQTYNDDIATEILKRAQGNFLWVHLAVDRINHCHTREDVDAALKNLPPGMEALYERMTNSLQRRESGREKRLALDILAWVFYSTRLLCIEELNDALGYGVLDIKKTVAELCEGLVTVDAEGRVAVIHETAREYLSRRGTEGEFLLEPKSTQDILYRRCMKCLMEPALRGKIGRNKTPALLKYAVNNWSSHLLRGSKISQENLIILQSFLTTSHVLTWISLLAMDKELGSIIAASRNLARVVMKLQKLHAEGNTGIIETKAMNVISSWATDLVQVVGKFGRNLVDSVDSIYKMVPAFCPESSSIHQLFGKKEKRSLQVMDPSTSAWDDCLARLSLDPECVTSSIHAAGGSIIILGNKRRYGLIYIFNATTFDLERQVLHPERVFRIHVDRIGQHLISYGFSKAIVWRISSGQCLRVLRSPDKQPRPQAFHFDDNGGSILCCGEDRGIRSSAVDNPSSPDPASNPCQWNFCWRVNESTMEQASLNSPICSSFSPDGRMIAFGYRRQPVTVWELLAEGPDLVRQCEVSKDFITGNGPAVSGEVLQVEWHPFSEIIFGLQRDGLLFRWAPLHTDEPSSSVQSGAHFLTISQQGSLVATGDTFGTVKVYTSADLSLIYQLSSTDPVHHLCFSADSRRLYDIRGSHANIWEPNVLVRQAENSDLHGLNNDSLSETDSFAKVSLMENRSFRTDNPTAILGQPRGDLYVYGTEDGFIYLGQIGLGTILELDCVAGFMSIERLAWSDDGRLVALANLSGRLSVLRLTSIDPPDSTGNSKRNWHVEKIVDMGAPQWGIQHLVFHPDGGLLFISMEKTGYILNFEDKKISHAGMPSNTSAMRWCCHPNHHDLLVGFGHTEARIFSWQARQELRTLSYYPLQVPLGGDITQRNHTPEHGWTNLVSNTNEHPGKLFTRTAKEYPEILLEMISSSDVPSSLVQKRYLVFSWSDIDSAATPDSEGNEARLPYMALSQGTSNHIREPLGLLSRGRLVFLDKNRWVCTAPLPRGPLKSGQPHLQPETHAQGSGRSAASQAEALPSGLERHYFLPSDWVSQGEAHLCSAMSDGTLLCPRNGEVATVRCARLMN